MSKDLKDLIDSVEKEAISKTELEEEIRSLKEEINRLNFTIKEQNIIIENSKNRSSGQIKGEDELPSEIQILKDIINSQRMELNKKDDYIENLNKKLDELSSGLEDNREIKLEISTNEELIDAQKLIVELSEEIDHYKEEIELLNSQIEEAQIKKIESEETREEDIQSEENEELINIKRLNFHLMEENGLLRVENESLKAQLKKLLEATNSEELSLANEKSDILLSKLKEYKKQIENLQEQLEKSSEPAIISTEDALEFADMSKKIEVLQCDLLKYQKENQELVNIINTLKTKEQRIEKEKDQEIIVIENIPKKSQSSLFDIMYFLLEDNKKEAIIDFLIQDLHNDNIEVKRTAIKILSKIKDTKVYDAFLKAINDENWLIRYSIIKALSEYEVKSDDLRVTLNKFIRDKDVDVRELVLKLLSDITK